MKYLWILVMSSFLYAETVDCTKVFEDRKSEIMHEVDKVDEARQSFEALQAATNALFDKQRASLKAREDALAKSKADIDAKEKHIASMIEENKKLLELLDGKKNGKMDDTYNKMKDAAAAAIIEKLTVTEGAAIVFGLPAKKISQIFAKMNPQIASEITLRIKQGPPFVDDNQTQK